MSQGDRLVSRDLADRLTADLRPAGCVCNGFGYSVQGTGIVVNCPVHKPPKVKKPRWRLL